MKRTLSKPNNYYDFNNEISIISLPQELLKLVISLIINSSQTPEEINCRIFTPFIYVYSIKQTCHVLNRIIKSILYKHSEQFQDWSFFRLYQWPDAIIVQQPSNTKIQMSSVVNWLISLRGLKFREKYDDLISSKLKSSQKKQISLLDDLYLLIKDAVRNTDFSLFLWIFQVYCCFLKTNYDVSKYKSLLLISSFTNNKIFIINWFFQNCSNNKDVKDFSRFTNIWTSILLPIIKNDYLDSFIRLTHNYALRHSGYGMIEFSTLTPQDKSFFQFEISLPERIINFAIIYKAKKILNYIIKMPYFFDKALTSEIERQQILTRIKHYQILDSI